MTTWPPGDEHRPVWLPGFFAPQLHAVTPNTDHLACHGVLLGWSICGRAAVLDSHAEQEQLPHCPVCIRRTAD